jgi:hypothetical protein
MFSDPRTLLLVVVVADLVGVGTFVRGLLGCA